MSRTTRLIGIGVATTLAAFGLELMVPATVSAARATLSCNGITGDNASSLGDSKKTLALIAPTGLSVDVDINATVPAKVRPGSGPFDASFTVDLSLPSTVVATAKSALQLTSLTVTNTTFTVDASGAASGSISKTIPSRVVDLNASSVRITETLTGKINPTQAGNILFRPGATRFSVVINKTIAGQTINTLGIECTGNALVGTTAVSVPGSPNIGGNFNGAIWGGGNAGGLAGIKLLDTPLVTPDDGNPVVNGSLKVAGPLPAGTAAGAAGGALFFSAPNPGAYAVPMQVCGASRLTRFVPGVNEVQKFTWGEVYGGRDLNAHPISVTLKWNGKETAPISLSQTPRLFAPSVPTPVDSSVWDFADRFLSQFVAPSAGAMQAALETIMGAGNVAVTGGLNGAPYLITFQGALGKGDQPTVEVGKWNTWLPGELLVAAQALISPPTPTTLPGQTTTTTAPPRTDAQLDADLAAGTITVEQWFNGKLANVQRNIIAGLTGPESIKALTALFPAVPAVTTNTQGSAEEPSVPTGELCTSFNANFIIGPAAVLGTQQNRATRRVCTKQRVKVSKNRYRTRTVCRQVPITPAKRSTTRRR